MSFQIIQDFSTDDATVSLGERTFPVPSLIEDVDGVRALLLGVDHMDQIPGHLWAQAHPLGAAYLLVPASVDTWNVAALTTEQFIAVREDDVRRAMYVIPKSAWGSFVKLPTYRDLVSIEHDVESHTSSEVAGFVNVHQHTEYSALDGLTMIDEAIETVLADGQQALASTDHGNCAAHPELAIKCAAAGIKPIFGMEANLVPDRHRRGRSWFAMVDADGTEYEVDPESVDEATRKTLVKRSDSHEALYEYQHITLWAMNDVGLRNLWAMSTESYREGFYGRPRLDWDTLTRLNEGVMASTGCLRGPIPQAILADDLALAHQRMARMLDIFGDRLYVEIHTNQLEEQIKVNHASVTLARSMGVPMLAAVDSHYARKDQQEVHRAWLAVQTGKDLSEDSSLFAGGQEYHMKTTDEVVDALSYLDDEVVLECIQNTAALANRCTATLAGEVTTPTFSKPSAEHPDPVKRDVERLVDLCLSNWGRKVVGKPTDESVYENRFADGEMDLLIRKDFCGYYLVVHDYVAWAKSQGCLVGPGRGSGGGSLVAYLADIVEIDPVDLDLIFERFLTEGRVGLPDFDIDFPASWRERIKTYLRGRWGEDYVISIGTVTRLRSKGAFNDAMRVLKPTLAKEIPYVEAEKLRKALTAADAPLAGKHMPWDDFCNEFSDIVDPMRAEHPEIFALTDAFMGRVKSYGKHPAGVVVSTDKPLTDLPMRIDDEGNLISQFDMVALEMLGLVKFDLLTLRTLDTIQETVDLIEARYGTRIDPYEWKDEYRDPQVWDEVSAGHTLGIFQIETPAGTRLTREYQPQNIKGMAAVMTLVRPGPSRSGLTKTYLARKAGLEPVTYPDPRLAAVLGDTYGAIIYQEQVMACCMLLGGYDSTEADYVRKILGKKQVEKVEAAGREFILRTVERGMDQAAAEHLWEQLAEFAKYGFGKAHAFGYAVLGYWCVAGPTRLYDWEGRRYISIAKAFKEGVQSIACYDESTGQTVAGEVDHIVKTGRKDGYVLRTKSNKRLECSEMHLILTDQGWKHLKDIRQGDLVASERRVSIMDPARRTAIADAMSRYWREQPVDEIHRRTQLLNDGQDFTFRSERAKRRWAEMDQVERQERVAALIDSAIGGRTWGARRQGVSPECQHRYASRNEREVCRWFHAHGLEHESQVFVGGRPADFRCQGVFIEFDGMGRPDSYFEEKFGEETFVVIRDRCNLDRDLGFLLDEELLRAGGVVTFEPVVSITPTSEIMMYDVIMKNDPHNFLADGVVVHNTAWFKFHFPVQFLTAALSTVDDGRIPEFINEARRMGYAIGGPDVNESAVAFTPADMTVRYGLASVKGVGHPTAQYIVDHAPYTSLTDFTDRCLITGSPVDSGHLKALVGVGAFDSMIGNRRAVEMALEDESSGAAKKCHWKEETAIGPGGLPCVFDWEGEIDPPMVAKGRGKDKTYTVKAPPKKCTVGCRNYTRPEPIDPDTIEPYTAADIRERERELLGVWLSSTPFSRFNPDDLATMHTSEEVEDGPIEREYIVGALLEGVKEKVDRNGNRYAFIQLNAQNGSLDAICFSETYAKIKPILTPNALVLGVIWKTDRGLTLTALAPY